MTFFKGMCYQPLPAPYDPSTANDTCIFFGSDIAYAPMAPLWGTAYTSEKGSGCGSGTGHACRDDLGTLKAMGVDLVRLYDWEPRNLHRGFLDRCAALGIKVLASVSNYFLKPGEGLPNRDANATALIDSFSNAGRSDYHEAIAGIIMGNEPRLNGFDAGNCVAFSTAYVDAEEREYAGYRRLPIGHPVDFNQYGGRYPCWGFWDALFGGLAGRPDILDRIVLAPQTYNDRIYLFENAEGSGKGYVELTWQHYGKPILFTEIGLDRTKPNYQAYVRDQLMGSLQYGAVHPEVLLGACFFQFADKVWLPKNDPEGSHGAFTHGRVLFSVEYGNGDFTHWDHGSCDGQKLNVDELEPTPLHDVVKSCYLAS